MKGRGDEGIWKGRGNKREGWMKRGGILRVRGEMKEYEKGGEGKGREKVKDWWKKRDQ